jgi:hypothetical protein
MGIVSLLQDEKLLEIIAELCIGKVKVKKNF